MFQKAGSCIKRGPFLLHLVSLFQVFFGCTFLLFGFTSSFVDPPFWSAFQFQVLSSFFCVLHFPLLLPLEQYSRIIIRLGKQQVSLIIDHKLHVLARRRDRSLLPQASLLLSCHQLSECPPGVLAGIRSFLKSWGPEPRPGVELGCIHTESFLLVLPQSRWGHQLLTGLFQPPLWSLDVGEEEEEEEVEEAERPFSSECTCLCVRVQKMQHRVPEDCSFQKVTQHFIEDQKGVRITMSQKSTQQKPSCNSKPKNQSTGK